MTSYSHMLFFFFKQNTAYEMRISDWSSDVCSSDLGFILGHKMADQHKLQLARIEVFCNERPGGGYGLGRIDLHAIFEHSLRGGLRIGLGPDNRLGFGQGAFGVSRRP